MQFKHRFFLITASFSLWTVSNILWKFAYESKLQKNELAELILGPYQNFSPPEDFSENLEFDAKSTLIDLDKPTLPPVFAKRTFPKIVFIKTMKTGSTAIQNVLFRVSETYGLKIGFPKSAKTSTELGKPDSFGLETPVQIESVSMLPPQIDMILHRMKYSDQVEKMFSPYAEPQNRTLKSLKFRKPFTFTILRHPFAVLKSIFQDYSSEISGFKPFKSLNEFLSSNPKPAAFDKSEMFINNNSKLIKNQWWLARNVQYMILGYESDAENHRAIINSMKDLDNVLDLVLIQEQMLESLVILKRKLGLSFRETVTFYFNVHEKSSEIDDYNYFKRKAENFNRADFMVYKHFLKRFEEIKVLYGRNRLRNDVLILEKMIKLGVKKCIQSSSSDLKIVGKDYRPYHSGNSVGRPLVGPVIVGNMSKIDLEYCHSRMLNEYEYSQELRRKQEAIVIAETISWK